MAQYHCHTVFELLIAGDKGQCSDEANTWLLYYVKTFTIVCAIFSNPLQFKKVMFISALWNICRGLYNNKEANEIQTQFSFDGEYKKLQN